MHNWFRKIPGQASIWAAHCCLCFKSGGNRESASLRGPRMTLLEGFHAAIAENTEDDSQWLILADWLDDQDNPRGELVRLLHALRQPHAVVFNPHLQAGQQRKRGGCCRDNSWSCRSANRWRVSSKPPLAGHRLSSHPLPGLNRFRPSYRNRIRATKGRCGLAWGVRPHQQSGFRTPSLLRSQRNRDIRCAW